MKMYDKLQFDALDDSVISSFKEPTYLNLEECGSGDGIIQGK
jgi:starch synthase